MSLLSFNSKLSNKPASRFLQISNNFFAGTVNSPDKVSFSIVTEVVISTSRSVAVIVNVP